MITPGASRAGSSGLVAATATIRHWHSARHRHPGAGTCSVLKTSDFCSRGSGLHRSRACRSRVGGSNENTEPVGKSSVCAVVSAAATLSTGAYQPVRPRKRSAPVHPWSQFVAYLFMETFREMKTEKCCPSMGKILPFCRTKRAHRSACSTASSSVNTLTLLSVPIPEKARARR